MHTHTSAQYLTGREGRDGGEERVVFLLLLAKSKKHHQAQISSVALQVLLEWSSEGGWLPMPLIYWISLDKGKN
jgi:hypothetical protein